MALASGPPTVAPKSTLLPSSLAPAKSGTPYRRILESSQHSMHSRRHWGGKEPPSSQALYFVQLHNTEHHILHTSFSFVRLHSNLNSACTNLTVRFIHTMKSALYLDEEEFSSQGCVYKYPFKY